MFSQVVAPMFLPALVQKILEQMGRNVRNYLVTWPRGYKTCFMLNSAEHEICFANKSQITNNGKFFHAKHS